MKLEGQVALITGASRGIGREIALAFAREGADIGVNYRSNRAAAEEVAVAVRELGRKAVVIEADVSQVEPVQAMTKTMMDEFGKIDILVANAGIMSNSPLVEMPVEMWDEMIATDLRGVFLCARFTVPYMLERNFGRVIVVASQIGQIGRENITHYSAAKGGAIAFTKALARELGRSGITVNALCPGPIDTDMQEDVPEEVKARQHQLLPLGRFGTVEEVAPSAVLLAASPDGDIYTGQSLGPNCGDVML